MNDPELQKRLEEATRIAMTPKEFDPVEDRIIRHSLEKFVQFGFARITIEEICRDLRMSKKTFYKYFKNRDALVEGIMMDNFRTFSTAFREILGSGKLYSEIMENYFQFLRNVLTKRISAVLLEDLEIHMPRTWELVRAFRKSQFSMMEELIRRGIDEGGIRADLNPRNYIRIMMATIDSVAVGSFLKENDITFVEAVEMMRIMFIDGIQPRD